MLGLVVAGLLCNGIQGSVASDTRSSFYGGLPTLETSKFWSKACSFPGTQETDTWLALGQQEVCDQFVGDGRVQSVCRPVVWEKAGTTRARLTFTDDNEIFFIEQLTPNRLLMSPREPQSRSENVVLGRATVGTKIKTLHLQCQ